MTKQEQIKELIELQQAMEENATSRIYATVTRVSNSGMSRCVKFYYVNKDGYICNLTPRIARIMGYRLTDYGVRIGGCGMDVIFNTLYNINDLALYYDLISADAEHNERDLLYHGLVNTNYWSL